MKAYYSLFKLTLIKGLQYRAAALAGVSTQFFWGFMYIMIYQAFYLSTNVSQPIALAELVPMVWLQQAFLVLFMLWIRDNEIISLITKGNVAYELCRPTNLYNLWYAKLIASRLSGALLRCIPILIIAFFLPAPYNFTLPSNFTNFVLFLITLILGLIIIVAVSMLYYISIFYTLNPAGLLILFSVIGEFFAGMTIPVPLMPKGLQILAYALPFRYASDLPFRIYVGHIHYQEAILSIFMQLIWIIVLITIGKLWMNKTFKKVVIQGG